MGSHLLIYIVKRLLVMIPTLFVIALICFVVLNLAPGRPGQATEAAQASGSEEARNQRRIFRETFNLDKPVLFNGYFLVERGEVEALIAESLDQSASARDRVEARYRLEDYGNYIVPELVEILRDDDDPAVRAFASAQLRTNGQMRNLFLGAEDDTPEAIRDEQRTISRHNQAISEWRTPEGFSIVPEGFTRTWPPAPETCTLPLDARVGYCAVETSPAEDVAPASLTIGQLSGLDATTEPEALLARVAAAAVPGLELVASQPVSSADTVSGVLAYYGAPAATEGAAPAVERAIALFVREGQAVLFVARIPGRDLEAQRASIERTVAAIDTGFFALLDERAAQWLAWYDEHAERFDLDNGEKIAAFFTDTRFFKYMANLLSGDFGFTITKRPVLPEILSRLKYSFVLSLLSVFFIYLLAIPIGIFSAVRQHTVGDQILTVCLFILYSLPTFFVGTLIVQYTPDWVPFATSGFETNPVKEPYMGTGARLWDICMHLVFPVITMTYGGLAALSRYARTGLLDVIRADYIRTARAKGLSETVVILKHAVRNGMIPILTILGTLLPVLFGGSIVVEYIFEIDGIGRYMFQAIQLRDYTVIMGILLISAVMTLVGLLISDISYALVDPRITFD